MHVELVELLRCPHPHEESALVAWADRSAARVILDGSLGCPLCGADFPIRDGVVAFADAPAPHGTDASGASAAVDDDEAMRVAALLDAQGRGSTIALFGGMVALARAVQGIAPARCLVVDPADPARAADRALPDDPPLAVMVSGGALPVAAGALTGVLLADDAIVRMDAVLAALRAGGRLAAPATLAVPPGVRELVRDARHWVGERAPDVTAAPAALVQLRRRR